MTQNLMEVRTPQKVICNVCGAIFAGRIPKGGDGSMLVPYFHKKDGKICDGSWHEARLIDDLPEASPLSVWQKTGFKFLEEVDTVAGRGLVQGVLKTKNHYEVIVSIKPENVKPPYMPWNGIWTLFYFHPDDVHAVNRLKM
jgi:hypothetical protein